MLTVRHLADRDPAARLPGRVAGRLFDAFEAKTCACNYSRLTGMIMSTVWQEQRSAAFTDFLQDNGSDTETSR